MNRHEEYIALLKELEETPPKLAYTTQRLEAKVKYNRSWHQWLKIPLASILGSLLIFTVLVNNVPVFAASCSRIPVIKRLVQFVAFSPSLKAAVENEFVQPINKQQTKNDITVTVEYLIVDQKQINVFYTIDSEVYNNLNMMPKIKPLEGHELIEYSSSSGKSNIPNGELNYTTIDFFDKNVPSGLQLEMEVYSDGNPNEEAIVLEDTGILEELPCQEQGVITTFQFNLSFDPEFTAQSDKIILNQNFNLDGQKMILEDIEIYPTHMSINIEDDLENTSYLKGMTYYIENEKGERFEKVSNGVSAIGKKDSPMMASYRLESTFFSQSKELTLYITEAEWLDKTKQKMKLNLVNQTAEELPQGITFEKAERKENGWNLVFGAEEYKEDHMYDIWHSTYYDEAGKEYMYSSWHSTSSDIDEKTGEYIEAPKKFFVEIPLINYKEDSVYMSPCFSHYTQFEQPVVIKLK